MGFCSILSETKKKDTHFAMITQLLGPAVTTLAIGYCLCDKWKEVPLGWKRHQKKREFASLHIWTRPIREK